VVRSAIALLLVVGTAVSYGAAAQRAAEMSARSCCTHDCGHGPAKAADPSRCCGVAPADAAPASVAPAAPSAAPALVALSFASPALLADASSVADESPDLAAARAAPVFLLTRSLRI
jgi:hypothetical protein